MRFMSGRTAQGRARTILTLAVAVPFSAAMAGCASVEPLDSQMFANRTQPVLCLGNPRVAAGEPLHLDEDGILKIVGEITTLRDKVPLDTWNIFGCAPQSRDPSLVLELTDEDGTTWTLGLGLRNMTTLADETPPLDLREGQRVNVQIGGIPGRSGDRAIALRDEEGLVIAFEWPTGDALKGRIEGLDVVRGAPHSPRYVGDCGTVQFTKIRFIASDVLELVPPERGIIHIKKQRLEAMACSASILSGDRCPDAIDTLGWMIWRSPPEGS